MTDSTKTEITITNRTIVRIMLVVVLTLIAFAAIQKISNVLVLIFVAFFLALALNAPVHWIAIHLPGKRRGSRSVATSISFLIVVLALAGLIASIVPPAVRQTSHFVDSIPRLSQELQDENSGIGKFVHRHNLENRIDDVSHELTSGLQKYTGKAFSTVTSIGGAVFSVLTVLVMTFMMLVEGPRWVSFGLRLAPVSKRTEVKRVTGDMYKVIKGYINGQVALAAIAAFMLLPGLLILNIPYAGALAAIVFICGLIPMIGHTIGATIVTLVALSQSVVTALLILGYYTLYQQIENYVLQPRIQSNTTNLTPLLVFVSVIIGVSLRGPVGGLVAIPVAACLKILVVEYLRKTGRLAAKEANELKFDTKSPNQPRLVSQLPAAADDL